MEKNIDPKIYLGIDNCFAIKRWTEPDEWGNVIKNMGLNCVEAVPDLECEPLLTPDDYRKDWIKKVNLMQELLDMNVVMFYSNDSTYDSIGFSHPDERVRKKFVFDWFDKFIDMAAAIGSDIGYYVQATPDSMLYERKNREQSFELAKQCMTEVNIIAARKGIKHVVLEQMYTPHQPPFTISGMKKLMAEIWERSGVPLYFTEDVGHHCPKYIMPSEDMLDAAAEKYAKERYVDIWLGSSRAYDIFTSEAINSNGKLSQKTKDVLYEEFDINSDAFESAEDTDCYEWLKDIGAWSPVIHMQQTDGTFSSHEAFLPENNNKGKIHPVKVLRALAESYKKPAPEYLPEQCEQVYLIQELYLSTKDIGYQGLQKLQKSTDYLRQFIPKDGMNLSDLLRLNEGVDV